MATCVFQGRMPESASENARAVAGRADRNAVSINAVNGDHGRRRLGGRRRPDIAAEAPAPNRAHHLVEAAAGERVLTRHHLVQHHAQGPDVVGFLGRQAREHLRRQIAPRPARGVGVVRLASEQNQHPEPSMTKVLPVAEALLRRDQQFVAVSLRTIEQCSIAQIRPASLEGRVHRVPGQNGPATVPRFPDRTVFSPTSRPRCRTGEAAGARTPGRAPPPDGSYPDAWMSAREMNADHVWSLTIPAASTDPKLTPKVTPYGADARAIPGHPWKRKSANSSVKCAVGRHRTRVDRRKSSF